VGDAIGQMLPSAIGVAISPMPIVAVVLMLVTERGRVNGPAFVIGWWLGIAIVGGLVLALSSGANASDDGEPATWVGALKLILGLGLLLLAAKQWQARPREPGSGEMPAWMSTLDSLSPAKAGGLAAVLAGVNPKNLLLIVAGAAAIAQTGIDAGEQAIALVIFILIASLGVMAPVVAYFLLGERSQAMLADLKDWLTQNSATIMAVVLLVLGFKLVGDGISGLS
jgi:threonine/homoserine/homoserine lactone efflux protein